MKRFSNLMMTLVFISITGMLSAQTFDHKELRVLTNDDCVVITGVKITLEEYYYSLRNHSYFPGSYLMAAAAENEVLPQEIYDFCADTKNQSIMVEYDGIPISPYNSVKQITLYPIEIYVSKKAVDFVVTTLKDKFNGNFKISSGQKTYYVLKHELYRSL